MSQIQRAVSIEPLTDAECRSLAPARAKRLAYSLAGRARALYELATGEPAVDDGGATPLNPQGLMGIDRSGPPWGDAHLHPVWTMATTANVGSDIYPDKAGSYGRVLYLDGGSGTITRLIARFYVRPFAVAPLVPYSRVYLRGVGTSDDLVTTSSATIRVYGPDGDRGPSTSATVSTTTSAAFSTGAYCLVSPGWNERVIEIDQTSANGIYIGPLSLNQVVRRTH
jgi:hypothetical protein